MTQFIKYIGSKYNMSKKLISMFPKHEGYVEVFFGSGAVFFNKPKSKVEIINDIDGNIVNLFKVIQNKHKEFLDKCKYMIYSRELLLEYHKTMNEGNDIERAFKLFYVLNSSFNTFITQRKPYWSSSIIRDKGKLLWNKVNLVDKIHKRLKEVQIDNRDFENVIERYNKENTFFFLDPPYYNINRLYIHDFTTEDHERLYECIKNIKGKFLMTINDCEWIRNTYKDFNIIDNRVRYNSWTNDKNKLGNAKDKTVNELIITNYVKQKVL